MVSAYIIFILSLIMIRFFAGYDSRFQKGRYVTVKNPVIRAILTDRTSFFERTNRRKEDIPKMSVCSVIFYVAAFVVLIINLVFLIIPQIPVRLWVMETDKFFISADSLNEKVSALSILLLFLSLIMYMAIAIFGTVKSVTSKWIKVFLYIVTAIMFLCASTGFFYFLTKLVFCFIPIK